MCYVSSFLLCNLCDNQFHLWRIWSQLDLEFADLKNLYLPNKAAIIKYFWLLDPISLIITLEISFIICSMLVNCPFVILLFLKNYVWNAVFLFSNFMLTLTR